MIVVIGAGLSGLAAAFRLQQAGHEMQVLEAAALPGGRCRTFRRDGFIVDTGPEISAINYARFLALAHSVGLGAAIVPSSTVVSVLRGGKMIDIDSASPASMLVRPLLSWRAKGHFAYGVFKHRQLLRRANAFRLTALVNEDDPTTNAEELSVRAFGREAADYLIDPMMRTSGGSHMSTVSAVVALGGIASFSSPMVTLLGGLSRLPEAVTARLKVTYNARVSRVDASADGVNVQFIDAAGTSRRLRAEQCIVAAQFDDAERIYPDLLAYSGEFGQQLKFVRLLDVKLAYNAPTHSKAYVAQMPTIENPEVLMFTLSHNKAPDRAPPGHSLFTIYSEHTQWDRLSALSNDAIIEWGRRQMEILYPEVKGHFLFGHVEREPKTVCFADPGYYRRVVALQARIPRHSRVQLAGDVFGAGSMEAAVVWGEAAADRLLG